MYPTKLAAKMAVSYPFALGPYVSPNNNIAPFHCKALCWVLCSSYFSVLYIVVTDF